VSERRKGTEGRGRSKRQEERGGDAHGKISTWANEKKHHGKASVIGNKLSKKQHQRREKEGAEREKGDNWVLSV